MATDFTSKNTIEIIAFHLHGREFCVKTTSIREIRGWQPSTPIPHSPPEVMGVMNLRGSVIPIIDLAQKLEMTPARPDERSAIVVTEVGKMVIGLLVDRVSDILTVSLDQLQPIPPVGTSFDSGFADGLIAKEDGMICFLNLQRMFADQDIGEIAA